MNAEKKEVEIKVNRYEEVKRKTNISDLFFL